MKFDLGGIGKGEEGFRTVNLVGSPNVLADIQDLDSFCDDGTVEEFRLSHTLEHISRNLYKKFLKDLYRKLCVGGVVDIVQSDALEVIEQYKRGDIPFRCMKKVLFPPSKWIEKNDLMLHQNMWSEEDLRMELGSIGFEASPFDGGFWYYDLEDEFFPEIDLRCHRKIKIKNLGVRGVKQ